MRTRVLTLDLDDRNDAKLFRIEKHTRVRFTLGASLMGCESDVHMLIGEEKLDVDVAVPFDVAGPCKFALARIADGTVITTGHILVDPELVVRPTTYPRRLPLDCITSCTYLTKLLGPLSTWRSKLAVAHASGYNMVHLTPIQRLGQSRSSYSIADQLACMDSMGDATYDDVAKLTKQMKDEWGMLTIGDVVWNHTADNSPWLLDHPDAGYNLVNSAHLQSAYRLDRALADFGARVVANEFAADGLPSLVEHEHHLGALRELLWTHVFTPSSLDLPQAVDALIGHVKYERVDGHGPRLQSYSKTHPLFPRYFADPPSHDARPEPKPSVDEILAAPQLAVHVLAYNGWVMAHNPMHNFAEKGSQVYLHRQLICWGDSVKLRYGACPSDSPYLWEHMSEYTRRCAHVFDGLRLDNCHNTPVHVAEHLLREARKVKPDLYVVAELFTGDEAVDNLFVNRLGITSLIREAQSAPDAHELGRLVYKYGGTSIGAFHPRVSRPLVPGTAHACLMDVTHDNPCPVTTRTALDLLPTAALVSMACCATGSSRGYDELVDYHIDVVKETRQYRALSTDQSASSVSATSAIIHAKALLNALHVRMANEGYDQIYVDQKTPHTVCVTRHRPSTHESIVMLARTAFHQAAADDKSNENIVIEVGGRVEKVLFEMRMVYNDGKVDRSKDTEFVCGLGKYSTVVAENLHASNSTMLTIETTDVTSRLIVRDLPPGAVVCVHIALPSSTMPHVRALNTQLSSYGYNQGTSPTTDTTLPIVRLKGVLKTMSLRAFNRLLYRCDDEERAESDGMYGAFQIPNFTTLVYCGLAGLMPVLEPVSRTDDLSHPLCDNIRQGDWLVDYIIGRLQRHADTSAIGDWLASQFVSYRHLPHYLKPAYFDAITTATYSHACDAAVARMTSSGENPSAFTRSLLLGTLQFVSECRTAQLPLVVDDDAAHTLTISAGLPHFSHGLFRCWGRDTFIALSGCLLVTERFEDAANVIVAFAGSLRHGLIPNLLGGGTHARYNCRDAVWWWMQAIVEYVDRAPNGHRILGRRVKRLYANDDDEAYACDKVEPLSSTMQEALTRHYEGIAYRERNAGHDIDEHMKDNGFNVTAYIDRERGFVMGGNVDNCGTWMDKMGGSSKAGNRGEPATPRDGAAIELQGLCASVVDRLADWHTKGHYPFDRVEAAGDSLTWTSWSSRMRANMVACFVVPENADAPVDAEAMPNTHFINLRGIVKDSWRSTQGFTDYQLRPNFVVALAVCPTLIPAELAWRALNIARDRLVGPLGMRTLDKADWAYHGDYENDDDSTNKATANGWNYHQGPEWVWVLGYYLRARLSIARLLDDEARMIEACAEVNTILTRHHVHMEGDAWRSLPELTNANGAYCRHSCRAQAWSMGCILDAAYDLDDIE